MFSFQQTSGVLPQGLAAEISQHWLWPDSCFQTAETHMREAARAEIALQHGPEKSISNESLSHSKQGESIVINSKWAGTRRALVRKRMGRGAGGFGGLGPETLIEASGVKELEIQNLVGAETLMEGVRKLVKN